MEGNDGGGHATRERLRRGSLPTLRKRDWYAAILYARQHVGHAPMNSGRQRHGTASACCHHPILYPAERFLVVFSGDLLRYYTITFPAHVTCRRDTVGSSCLRRRGDVPLSVYDLTTMTISPR